ncbi:hypothetical protein TWF106_006379 [Orbilia oligospora]|uniref:Uncharacterized protein n=1 Tax=Orbilia oligospora TaxID=2813651 RepID=A0A6G1MGN1_ORBOL|nr:hypothetical protein TWF788_006685 [Orbilia oligospora]KAF3206285.1 hypothetical protein TWF679_008802 [Orbilia oligospora]KAF3228863.1 hypothetical protein TWF106_006379 [Orbilia oligospora]KAF3231570.1 hypothetical protein TWF191_005636 [Orbilia oligospora]KAF3257726.1 hypothetical protein TWF192_001012 [Orbilia oligospora]
MTAERKTTSSATMKETLDIAVKSGGPLFLDFIFVTKLSATRLLRFACEEKFEGLGLRPRYDSLSRYLHIQLPYGGRECTEDFARWLWGSWQDAQLLPLTANEMIRREASPKVIGFVDDYEGSYQQPDFFLGPVGANFPSIAFETGFRESSLALISARDIWIKGTDESTKALVSIDITRVFEPEPEPDSTSGSAPRPALERQYKVFLEVWKESGFERVEVFPNILEEEDDPVITLEELWGNEPVPEGYDKDTELPLSRQGVQNCIKKAMGIAIEST